MKPAHKTVPGRLRRLAGLGPILLAACATGPPAATATLRPTPAVASVIISGELDPLRPALAACAASITDFGILVFAAETGAAVQGPDAVWITLGEPELQGLQAALLGFEKIVAVAAAESSTTSLTTGQLRLLYAGRESGLSAGDPAELWVPLPGTQARAELNRLMAGTAYSPEAFLAPASEAMVQTMLENPAAVGVLPAAWLVEGIRPILTLAELPVLAVTDGAPQGKLRELIGCLQLNPVYSD